MASFAQIITSSVGRKVVVAVTGIFLVLFLVVHCAVNMAIFWHNPEETFNRAAHFMGTNPLIRLSEIILFAGLLLHIYQGLYLHCKNRTRRSVRYAVSAGNKSSKWYTRSMGILGSLILIFLVVHLANFWVPGRLLHSLQRIVYQGESMHNMYALMQYVFQNPLVVLIYILGCLALGWHLYHGIQGAFRTFGVSHPLYRHCIHVAGTIFSIVVPLLFAAMPVVMYFQIEVGFHFG